MISFFFLSFFVVVLFKNSGVVEISIHTHNMSEQAFISSPPYCFGFVLCTVFFAIQCISSSYFRLGCVSSDYVQKTNKYIYI